MTNKPDRAKRRQPPGFRDRVGKTRVSGSTPALTHPGQFIEFIQTAEGVFTAVFSDQGLTRLEFPDGKKNSLAVPLGTFAGLRRWLQITEEALERILAGRAPRALPPLDLSAGTEFQRSVWHALKEILLGETRSYGEVAVAIGRPRAVRAVGQACGANPIPLLVPCHRVVAAGGKLGGFSGGLPWKEKLLARELKLADFFAKQSAGRMDDKTNRAAKNY